MSPSPPSTARKPVLCLTGAGTNPSLLTPDLTTALLEWDLFAAPSATGSGPTDLIRLDPSDTRANFFPWLAQQTLDAFAPGDQANFEDLIHIAELIGSILPLPPDAATATFARFYAAGLLLPSAAGSAISDKNLRYVAERAAMFVLQTVHDRTRGAITTDARTLMERLISSNFILRHCSLNYDTLAVPTSSHFWTGYPEGLRANTFSFAASPPNSEHLNIQMHGSVHFAVGGSLTDACSIVRFNNPDDASKTWGLSSSGHSAMDRHDSPRVPLIAGRRKAEKGLIEPFSSYLHYFRELAFSTPRWLVLGYGGGDYHINGVLQSAAEHWGSALRIFVCNYLPTADTDYDTTMYTVANGYPAYPMLATRQAGILTAFPSDVRDFFAAAGPLPTLNRNTTNKITERLSLTVDGAYAGHDSDIIDHLSSI